MIVGTDGPWKYGTPFITSSPSNPLLGERASAGIRRLIFYAARRQELLAWLRAQDAKVRIRREDGPVYIFAGTYSSISKGKPRVHDAMDVAPVLKKMVANSTADPVGRALEAGTGLLSRYFAAVTVPSKGRVSERFLERQKTCARICEIQIEDNTEELLLSLREIGTKIAGPARSEQSPASYEEALLAAKERVALRKEYGEFAGFVDAYEAK